MADGIEVLSSDIKSLQAQLMDIQNQLRVLVYGSNNSTVSTSASSTISGISALTSQMTTLNTTMSAIRTLTTTISSLITEVSNNTEYLTKLTNLQVSEGRYEQQVRDRQSAEKLTEIARYLKELVEKE